MYIKKLHLKNLNKKLSFGMKEFNKGILISIMLLSQILSAQDLSFNKAELQNVTSFYSLNPMAVVDMNDDLLDDIVILDRGVSLYIGYQQENGLGFKMDTLGVTFPRAQWNMAVADMNNDGIKDIVVVGNKDVISIVYRDHESIQLKEVEHSKIYTQSLNILDVNRDNFLDIFVTDDENRSRLFINDQKGEWIYQPDIFNEPNDETISAGNYGCVWEDFDQDGDQDLYIAKCKGGVDDPKDPRRKNKLFRQNEDGTFDEIASSLGLDFGSQSWTSNFGDLDNDGDMDLLVTNHDVEAFVLENDKGQFIDRTAFSGLKIEGAVIQSALVDFDNNGFLDILIGGSPSALYRNNGDWTFEEQQVPSDIYDIISFGIGDLNNDGFQDIYASYPKLVNQNSPLTNQLYYSEPNDNHFISFKLIAEDSNNEAIGASVQIFYGDHAPIKSIHSGESYGIMNSMLVHFGLGDTEKVDSVIVTWPNGEKINYYPDKVDEIFVLSDFECISIKEDISSPPKINICKGDSVILEYDSGTGHQWNNGAKGKQIVVYQSGSYVLTFVDDFGCKKYSDAISVWVEENQSPKIKFLEGDLVNCYKDNVVLSTDKQEVVWEANDQSISGQELYIDEATEVYCHLTGHCRGVLF